MKTKQRTKSLGDALKDLRQETKGQKGIEKHATALKVTTSKDADGSGSTQAVMEPTSEELAQINEFTRSPKQAHEVVVFSTLSCNDLWDRDDEAFTTQTVKDFAALSDPLGPVGKSYMVGHDYTKLPVGRIFDASSEDIDGVTWLKNKVYIPNTKSNESLIENIDFGVNWAVSVGVMLESAECSLSFCGATMYKSRFFGDFCANGHDKGYYYLENADEDSWGYPMPTDSKTSGAELCRTYMVGAKDFFELSQVFLGAQFYAALEKQPDFKGIVKAASAGKVPILGISRKEAESLAEVMPHLDPRAAHALKAFGAKWDEENTLKWTDDQSLVWTYSPDDSEVLCLGKDASSDEDDADEEENDGTAQEQPVEGAHGEDDGVVEESADEVVDDGEGDDAADDGAEVEEGVGSDGDLTEDTSADADATTDEEKAVSKAAVLKCLKALKAPATVLSAVEGSTGDSLDAALSPLVAQIKTQGSEIAALTPKAAMGDEYIKACKTEAVDWYVRANQSAPGKGVNTEAFTKMLDAVGDNIEAIKSLTEMQKDLAKAKFPDAVRRSSFPSDANTASAPADVTIPDVADKKVSRLHG